MNLFKRLLSLLGLDLYTKGKAAEGMTLSASDKGQKLNPFDVGIWRNCTDFWSRGRTLGVDYTSVSQSTCLVDSPSDSRLMFDHSQLYEVPDGGFKAAFSSRRADSLKDKRASKRSGGRYEMVSQTEEV